ncbi:ABC transporter substrate-binding protein [Bdellovibrionota bacterium FG-2]
MNVFFLRLAGEPTALNPLVAVDGLSRPVHAYVLDSLLARNENTNEWESALAESWSVSADARRFTFKLRRDVHFHDGFPLTSRDVKFSFDVIFDSRFPTAHLRAYYEGFDKVEALDPLTVRFTAKERYFRNFESAALMTILPQHLYGDPVKPLATAHALVGTGPYQVQSYEFGQGITLKKFQNWWGANDPQFVGRFNFAQIQFRFVRDENLALEMLKKGELDYLPLSAENYFEKTKTPEWGIKVFGVKAKNLSPKGFGYVGWNQKNPLFQDKRVRRALYHLLNRQLMIEKFRYGASRPATGPWYQQSPFASPKVKPMEFDPSKALRLLREAGWDDRNHDGVLEKKLDGVERSFEFTILLPNSDSLKYFTIYQEDAKKVGLRINLKVLEWSSLMKLVESRSFDALAMAWRAGSADIDPKQVWHSTSAGAGGSNYVGYRNPRVDALIDKARGMLEARARLPLLQKVYELIASDVPYAFLFNDEFEFYAHSARVHKPQVTLKYGLGIDTWSFKRGAP